MGATDRGMKRLIRAGHCSLRGLRCAFSEEAFRLEVYAMAMLGPLAFFLTADGIERALLIAALGLVLVTEVVNTAIERTVDRISRENHALSREAKDLGSAAVFLSMLVAGVIWIAILVF